MIIRAGVGVDNIDIISATENSVVVIPQAHLLMQSLN